MDHEADQRRETVIKYARPIGAGLTVLAIVLGYLCIYTPIQEATQGAESVSVSFKGALVAVIIAVFGPAYLIGGGRFVEIIWPPPGPWGFTNYAVLTITVAVGAGVFFGLRHYLGTLGYSF